MIFPVKYSQQLSEGLFGLRTPGLRLRNDIAVLAGNIGDEVSYVEPLANHLVLEADLFVSLLQHIIEFDDCAVDRTKERFKSIPDLAVV